MLRLAWLQSRGLLIKQCMLETACITLTYFVVNEIKLGYSVASVQGLISLIVSWLVVSYLVGRYSYSEQRVYSDKEIVVKSVASAVLLLVIYVLEAWLNGKVENATRLKGYVIPLLIGIGFWGSFVGYALRRSIVTKTSRWVLLVDKAESEWVQEEVNKSHGYSMSVKIATDKEELVRLMEPNVMIGISSRVSLDDSLTEDLLRRRMHGQEVVELVSWCEKSFGKIPPELVTFEWLSYAEGFTLRKGTLYWRTKRFVDIVVAILLLILTMPIMLVACVAIYLEDKESPFYRQKRSGLYGEEIEVLKLRTMVKKSELNGAQWAKASDRRVTKVGKILRASRIDELPQLVGVIKGTLSLVGPRPERPEIEIELERLIQHYRVRHWIKPGLSGWAQVCFRYGASVDDSREKLKYDLFYIRNASILLDFVILFKTIRMVGRMKGYRP